MNIAILTTWDSNCGIAEYSRNLVIELLALGHRVFLFTNKDPYFIVLKDKSHYLNLFVTKIFGVSWWGEDSEFCYQHAWNTINDLEKAYGPIDVLNIQYQSSLYAPSGFNEFLKGVRCPIVVTQHDSTVNLAHNFPYPTYTIAHNEEIPAEYYIPFPTIEKKPKIFSFGMGRNDYTFIEKACKDIGADFEGHDARKAGWLTEEALFAKMKESDVIVLWYDEVNLEGQSAALRTAISSNRPVIVNGVGWFNDAPKFVHKVITKHLESEFSKSAVLAATLIDVLHLVYIRENSYKECAKKYVRVFNEIKTN